MHGEAPRAREPLPVTAARVQLEERVAAAGRAVTQARQLPRRPPGPGQLAGGGEQRVCLGVTRQTGETVHHARRADAVLEPPRRGGYSAELLGGLWPVRVRALARDGCAE